MAITYPRPCPTCGKKYKNRFDLCRHKKYCERKVKVPCLHCNKLFSRKDKMTAHVRKFHSEETQRKAADTDELARLELLHAEKVPRLSVEHQTGGAVSTRGMKRVSEEEEFNPDAKAAKNENDQEIGVDVSEGCPEYTGWSNPTMTCTECNKQFFGEDCDKVHLI